MNYYSLISLMANKIDPDAQAFINAAGLTNSTQIAAVNNLVIALKANSLWTKMKAIYPFVGGTATTHKFNLKNPLDTNAAFRLVFNGGITHDANGATANGVNGNANTFLNALSVLTNSNLHVAWYSRTASTAGINSNEILPNATYSATNNITFRINNKVTGNAAFTAGNDAVGATVTQTLNGFMVGSETASNLRKLYRNGSVIATNTTNDTNALPNHNLNLWGATPPITTTQSGNNCAFASLGDGLSDAEVSTLYTIVQNYNTILSRQV